MKAMASTFLTLMTALAVFVSGEGEHRRVPVIRARSSGLSCHLRRAAWSIHRRVWSRMNWQDRSASSDCRQTSRGRRMAIYPAVGFLSAGEALRRA